MVHRDVSDEVWGGIASVIAVVVVAALLVKLILFGLAVLVLIATIGAVEHLWTRHKGKQAYERRTREQRQQRREADQRRMDADARQATEAPTLHFEDRLADAKRDGLWP